MARTVGEAIAQAREILQDEESVSYRYSDADLYSYLNNAISNVRRVRPDLFIYGEVLPSFTTTDGASDFPLPETYFQGSVYFIAGIAELRDDEFAVDNRAMTLITRFNQVLTGV